jgi:hypothetical protein
MSIASERRAVADTLGAYPLMTVPVLAAFLNCTPDHARGLLEDGRIPFTDIGRGSRREYRVDPMDAAAFHYAQREGLGSVASFFAQHGDAATELLFRYVRQIRRILVDAA